MTLSLTAENDALKAHVNSLREALTIINVLNEVIYKSRELDLIICKAIAPTDDQCLAIHDAKVIEEFRGRCEHQAYMSKTAGNAAIVSKYKREHDHYDKDDFSIELYTLPIDKE